MSNRPGLLSTFSQQIASLQSAIALLQANSSSSGGSPSTVAVTVTATDSVTPITISATFNPVFSSIPTFSYILDGSTPAVPLPNSAVVTVSTVSFSILPLSAGNHTIQLTGTNSSVSSVVSFSVTQATGFVVNTPMGLQQGQAGTITVGLQGTITFPVTYSLNDEAAVNVASATNNTFTVSVPNTLDVGQHFFRVYDAANVNAANAAFTFNVAPVPISNSIAEPGVPTFGPSFFGYVEQSNWTQVYNQWLTDTNIIPRLNLLFNSFDSIVGAVNHINSIGTTWANDPLTNGTTYGTKTSPVIGLCLWHTDGSCNFDTVIAGQNDSQIAQFVTAFSNHNWNVPLFIRLGGWECNYNTTPAGVGAQNKYGASGANSNDPLYVRKWIKAFRRAAHVIHTTAAANGVTAYCCYGPAHISQCTIDPRVMDPDNLAAEDNYGRCVDALEMDFYFGNCYGPIINPTGPNSCQIFDGYEKAAPFSVPVQTGTGDAVAASHNEGTLLAFSCFPDGNTQGFPRGFGGGWGWADCIDWAIRRPFGPTPIINSEMGGVTSLDGGTDGQLTTARPNGPFDSYDAGGPFASEFWARIYRRMIAYANSKGITVIGGCHWYYASDRHLQTIGAAFPENTRGWNGSTVSAITAIPATLTIATPIDSLTVGVSHTFLAGWITTKPTSVDYSFDNITWITATSPTINNDGSITFSGSPTVAGIVSIYIRDSNNHAVSSSSANYFTMTAPITEVGSTTAGLGTDLTAPGANFVNGGAYGLQGLTSLSSSATVPLNFSGGAIGFSCMVTIPNAVASNNSIYMGALGITPSIGGSFTGWFINPNGLLAATGTNANATLTNDTLQHHIAGQIGNDGQLCVFEDGRQTCRTYVGTAPANCYLRVDSPGGLAIFSQINVWSGEKYPHVNYPFNVQNTYTFVPPTGPTGVGDTNLIAGYRLNGNASGGASGGGGTTQTSGGATPTIAQHISSFGQSTMAKTITLPSAATAGNHVLLVLTGYADAAPTYVPTVPGFTMIYRKHVNANAQDITVLMGPVSALTNNGITFAYEINTNGIMALIETTAAHAVGGDLTVVADNTNKISVQVPALGSTGSYLQLGILMTYISPNSGPMTANCTILEQDSGGGQNMYSVIFVPPSSGNIFYTSDIYVGNGSGAQNTIGIGLELTT